MTPAEHTPVRFGAFTIEDAESVEWLHEQFKGHVASGCAVVDGGLWLLFESGHRLKIDVEGSRIR